MTTNLSIHTLPLSKQDIGGHKVSFSCLDIPVGLCKMSSLQVTTDRWMNVSCPREMSKPEGRQGVCGCKEAQPEPQFVVVNPTFMK